MNKKELIDNWTSDLYDQMETSTDDVDFMLNIIGKESKKILEVCCGSGRILIPLAMANHQVDGFDFDDTMLAKIDLKATGLNNLNYCKKDAVKDNWGENYDVVILAGNILINIVSDMDYRESQILFIKKAYDCLKIGGHLYLDFNLFLHPENIYNNDKERIIFQGTDNYGIFGKYSILNCKYDSSTQYIFGKNKTELNDHGNIIIQEREYKKYIPKLEEVRKWLDDKGFVVEEIYGGYKGQPITEKTSRAIIYAKK